MKKLNEEEQDNENLKIFLNHIYKDLCENDKINTTENYISKQIFTEFTGFSIFIADNLFRVFDIDNDEKLSREEFITGISDLWIGDYEKLVKIYFRLFDVDEDEYIYLCDIKIFLSQMVPDQLLNNILKFKDQSKDNYLENDLINFNIFKNICKFDSRIFIIIKNYFLENLPISDQLLFIFNQYRLYESNLAFHSLNLDKLLKCNINFSDENNKSDDLSISINNLRKLSNKLILNFENSERMNDADIDENLGHTINIPYIEKENKMIKLKNITPEYNSNNFNENHLLFPFFSNISLENYISSSANLNCFLPPDMNNFAFINFDGYVYKLTSSGKMRKVWIFFIKQNMLYFNSAKQKFLGIHFIGKSYSEMGPKLKINDKVYFSFNFIIKNQKKSYFCENQAECEKWIELHKKITNFRNINDEYEILDSISKGNFSIVYKGLNKKTKDFVAIKVVNKLNLRKYEISLVRNEIEILKSCRHKNIVKFIDNFETHDNIYIVLEYLGQVNLSDFLRAQTKVLCECNIKKIINQIAEGLIYLNKYGIIHRDLKPGNIMIDENLNLKLTDFGFSKIIGYNQKTNEQLGTLSYIAPEVICSLGYNKEIDVWSLGVILYDLLCGQLPFKDLDQNKTASKILNLEYHFPHDLWKNISQPAIDLVKKCLCVQNERIKIEDLINHPWIRY